MAKAKIFAGTSGYSYKEWKGSFYPEKLAQSKFLEFYSEKLATVEINNTFYRFPSRNLLENWRDQTPDDFKFAMKANQQITHKARLKDVKQITHDFVAQCEILGPKLGPILFQLPPFLKRDDERLREFLTHLPPGNRYALEFRHESWFDDEVQEMLSEAGAALCLSENDKLDTPRVATAGFCYIRLRKDEYVDADLADWSRWFDAQLKEKRDLFVYLKHDEKGESPERALQLLQGG